MKLNRLKQAVFLLVVLLSSNCISLKADDTSSVIGKRIENFSLLNTSGVQTSLSDYSDAKGFIIVFTCNHCPFAKLYSNRFNEMNKKYGPLKFPLLAINSMDTVIYEEESFEKMKQRAINQKFNFPYLQDNFQQVGKQFNAEHTPQTFVIVKENGNWIVKYSGAIDDNGAEPKKIKNAYVTDAVDELLAGKEISHPVTSSFGCAIFYRK